MTSYAGSTASRRRDHTHAFQRFPTPNEWNSAGASTTGPDNRDLLLRARKSSLASHHSHDSRSRPAHAPPPSGAAWDSASESGLSVLSALPTREDREQRAARKAARRAQRERDALAVQSRTDAARRADATDSPLRRAARWLVEQPALARYSVALCVAVVVLVKWCTGLGGYSGASLSRSHPPSSRAPHTLTRVPRPARRPRPTPFARRL